MESRELQKCLREITHASLMNDVRFEMINLPRVVQHAEAGWSLLNDHKLKQTRARSRNGNVYKGDIELPLAGHLEAIALQ